MTTALRLNAFMDHLIEFMEDLKIQYPDDIDIKTAWSQCEMWKDSTALQIKMCDIFMDCMYPFFKDVLHENEETFTNIENLKKSQGFAKYGKGDATVGQLLRMQELYYNLDPQKRKSYWAHLKALLIKGSAARLSSHPEYQQVLIYAKKHPELYR